jgi:nicotinate phosphoribosyltransferase
MNATVSLQSGDALVIVDVQNDFLPGGALAVPNGDEVISPLNGYIDCFASRCLPVFATRDCHPADHCSFRSRGGPWPEHCVKGSHGAQISPQLKLSPSTEIVSKPSVRDKETYSPFEGTGFENTLREKNVSRLFVGGLATDYCVLYTVLGARQRGFKVYYLRDAIRAVNAQPNDGEKAEREMKRAGAVPLQMNQLAPANIETSALLTDLYELTMLQGYFLNEMEETAVFEFFVRELPANRNFLIAAGLEQALRFLEELRFDPDELAWLASTQRFDPRFLDSLSTMHFTGDVDAMPEGTTFFGQEPVIRVTAPLPQAQLVETRLINLLHFQTLVASKAARCVLVAPGKVLVDFGMRRAHGDEAGSLAARASYLAGFTATSNVLAGRMFDIPLSGTMAHSFVQAHTDEAEAFGQFARANPKGIVLLLDTYDTEAAARKVIEVAPGWSKEGLTIEGVRLDSGDLAAHAFAVREILDRGGLREVHIFASGHLNEHEIQRLLEGGAPFDGFGIGSELCTSADAPYLDCAYKIQEYAGHLTRKRSEGKATWPGRKQVYRISDDKGQMVRDVIALDSDSPEGEPLLRPVMREGRRISPPVSLKQIRERCRTQLEQLPTELRQMRPAKKYRVEISESVRQLARSLDEEHHLCCPA